MAVNSPIASAVNQAINQGIAGGGAAATPLLTDLVAYWDLSEASGTRNDSHTNGYHLTDTNTCGQAAGVGGGQNAADFIRANSEKLNRAGSNDISGPTDTDFTVAFWVRHDSPVMGNREGVHCLGSGGWQYQKQTSDRPRFLIVDGSSTQRSVTHTTVYSVDTWYFVVCYFDNAASQAGISLNDGAAQTVACTGHTTGTASFEIGHYLTNYQDGRHQAFGIWNRRLTASEQTWLYNSGTAARLYADVSTYTG